MKLNESFTSSVLCWFMLKFLKIQRFFLVDEIPLLLKTYFFDARIFIYLGDLATFTSLAWLPV